LVLSVNAPFVRSRRAPARGARTLLDGGARLTAFYGFSAVFAVAMGRVLFAVSSSTAETRVTHFKSRLPRWTSEHLAR